MPDTFQEIDLPYSAYITFFPGFDLAYTDG